MGPPITGVRAAAVGRLLISIALVAMALLAPATQDATASAGLPDARFAAASQDVLRLPPAPLVRPGESIGGVEMALAALDRRIAVLDAAIPTARDEATTDQRRLRVLARAIYVEPSSLLAIVGRASSLGDVFDSLAQVSALGAAAHQLEARLVAANRLLDMEQQARQTSMDQRARLWAELVGLSSEAAWQQITTWERANLTLTFPPDPAHSKRYRFVWPEPGATIAQPFGPTANWMEPPYQGWAHFHTGIDLDLPYGSPVHAADDGIVIATGFDPFGYGRYVVLGNPGGVATLYGHLSAASVSAGDQVVQGQVIGKEGSTGNSTGPHVHFEVRIDFQSVMGGRPVDPTAFLPPGPPSAFNS